MTLLNILYKLNTTLVFAWADISDEFFETLVYTGLGIVTAVASYFIVDLIIPGNMGKQIAEDKNMAIAIVAGATILGICIIIASSISS